MSAPWRKMVLQLQKVAWNSGSRANDRAMASSEYGRSAEPYRTVGSMATAISSRNDASKAALLEY